MIQLAALFGSRYLWQALPYILGAAAVCGVLWWAYSWAYDRGYAAGEAVYTDAMRRSAEAYAGAVAHQQEIVTDLEARISRNRTAVAGLSGRLEGTLANDPESRDWGAVRVPDSVRGLLDEAGSPSLSADP